MFLLYLIISLLFSGLYIHRSHLLHSGGLQPPPPQPPPPQLPPTQLPYTHITTFDDMPLPCPGGCGRQGLVRRNMAQHLSTECPEELVACTYAIAGCQEVVKRKDLQRHLQDKDQHLDVVLRSYISLTHLVRDIAFTGNRQEVETSCLPLTFKYWLQNTPTCYP